MSRHVVHVPEYILAAPLKKYTAGQFLVEFGEAGGRTRIFDLPHPVRIVWVDSAEQAHAEVCRKSHQVFRLFDVVGAAHGVIALLSWRGCSVGPAGLYSLNFALRNHAVRKGGINIVRWWLQNRPGFSRPLRGDLAALFDYLEIRPLFRGKSQKKSVSSPTQKPSPDSLNAIRYVSNRKRHKVSGLGSGKRRSREKAKAK